MTDRFEVKHEDMRKNYRKKREKKCDEKKGRVGDLKYMISKQGKLVRNIFTFHGKAIRFRNELDNLK